MRRGTRRTTALITLLCAGLWACGDADSDTVTDTTQVADAGADSTAGDTDANDTAATDVGAGDVGASDSVADASPDIPDAVDPCTPSPCPPGELCQSAGGDAGTTCVPSTDPCDYPFAREVSYVFHLAIASQADSASDEAPADHCCFDFDGDNVVDNGLGALIKLINVPALFATPVNDVVADFITSGAAAILLETRDLDGVIADPSLDINLFYGVDRDGNYSDNLLGVEAFAARRESFLPDTATPRSPLTGASIASGNLQAGPKPFTLDIPFEAVTVSAEILDLRLLGRAALGDNGRGLSLDGLETDPDSGDTYGARLGGLLPAEALYASVNAYVTATCPCASLPSGQLLVTTGGDVSCDSQASAATCNEQDDDEATCISIVDNCNVALLLLKPDVDTDDDNTDDAFSFGIWLRAVSAKIDDLEPSCMPAQ